MQEGYPIITLEDLPSNKAIFDIQYTMKIAEEDREIVVEIGKKMGYLLEKYVYPFHKKVLKPGDDEETFLLG